MTSERLAQIPKAYDPHSVEERWYQFWMERGLFTPAVDPQKRPFVIIMPPPNVTGELHLGHALTATLEDIMVRWHRMRGEPTLWLPGIDHAGIAAQVVVENALAREGLSRQGLGREGFLERMWQWMGRYGRVIAEQHKRLGASCDWGRERFTMDEGPSLAVRTTFDRLYRKGLIYRGERIINWCPRCRTALSDLEVEHEETPGHLYYVNYRYADDDGHITVATTRPETILGDTAVAVNPEDGRYRAAVGREVVLPAVGRRIPVIADSAVAPEFGTGAVKVTPAHDPVDFEVGQRHGLASVNILNRDATMNSNAGPYVGLDRYQCREGILADLKRDGLLVKVEPHAHSVGHCCRCGAVVEPWVSTQWFVSIAPLAVPAIQAVVDGEIEIVPERFTRVYLNWMENIRDWCISRQLWWGHRIPAWYCADCAGDDITVFLERPLPARGGGEVAAGSYRALVEMGIDAADIERYAATIEVALGVEPIVGMEPSQGCPRCGGGALVQDPDVLDTWFSSALWPHSTLGWPEQTQDLAYFYPTSVMETGYDILFFWVARMIMMGLENTGEVPFRTVYLHGLVRDEKGEKMSKVKGNVLNPLDAIEQYGTDALRLALSTGTSPGNDVRVSSQRLEASRNFANKLWNASRFILGHMEGEVSLDGVQRADLPIEDRWILSRQGRVVAEVGRMMEGFQFGEAQRQVHDFVWGEFCDWYIELAKLRLRQGEAPSPLPVLGSVLETSLRLLHPFMPFITEELWQQLKGHVAGASADSIMVAPYPTADGRAVDDEAERHMGLIIEIVRAIRNVRAEHRVESSRWVEATIVAAEARHVVEARAQAIEALAMVRPLTFAAPGERPTSEQAVTLVLPGAWVILPMAGMVDLEAERRRLGDEIAQSEAQIARAEAKLESEAFLAKARPDVVQRERERLASHQERRERLLQRLRELGEAS